MEDAVDAFEPCRRGLDFVVEYSGVCLGYDILVVRAGRKCGRDRGHTFLLFEFVVGI